MNNRLRYTVYFIILTALAAGLLLCLRRFEEHPVYRKSKLLMGTVVEISVAGREDPDLAVRAVRDAFSEIERVEAKFSTFRPDSLASRINNLGPGEMLEVDDEMLFIVGESIRYYTLTNGSFDITVKPLVDLWGFSARKGKVPANEEIGDALTKIGSGHIILDKASKKVGFAKGGMRVDFGGIAKGYATDRAVEVMKAHGVKNAIVNSGGDMYCLGRKGPKERWRVGIQHPRARDRLLARLSLEGAAIDTSGDYENFFEVGGKRFCHIIDPKTGMPVGSSPSSATIISKSSMEAQALAKVFMVLGIERGSAIMDKNFEVDWVVTSEGPDGRIEIKKSNSIKRYAYKER